MRKLIILLLLIELLYACKDRKAEPALAGDLERDTTDVRIKIDTSAYLLANCTASLKNDTLQLAFIGNSWYDLQIIKTKDSIQSELFQNWAVTDTAFVKPTFKTVFQDVSFDKEKYKKGDRLKAKIKLSIAAYYQWPSIFTDTATLNGWVQVIVN